MTNMSLEVLRGDLALVRTSLEESSAALETIVVGAAGSGAGPLVSDRGLRKLKRK